MMMAPSVVPNNRPTGYKCAHPFEYEFEGNVRMRPCGSPFCKFCNARTKRDYAGRAAAEAYTSAECVALTLTYREGEKGAREFVTQDRSDAVKRIRQSMVRRGAELAGVSAHYERIRDPVERARVKALIDLHAPKVKYIGAGERGAKSTMRCHWHLVLFFDRARSGLVSTPRQADGKPGREHVSWWPHGWVNIDVLPGDIESKMRAARYCIKYMDKSRGIDPATAHGPGMPEYEAERRRRERESPWARDARGTMPAFAPEAERRRRRVDADARFFYSQGEALGTEYLRRRAVDHAKAGLPLSPYFEVPGVRFARGRGDLVKHFVFGRSRAHYVEAFEEAWAEFQPGQPVPMNEFLRRHGAFEARKAKDGASLLFKRGERPVPKPPLAVIDWKVDRSGMIDVTSGGRRLGIVVLSKTGFATFERAADGRVLKLPGGSLRDLVDMDEAAHRAVEDRIAELRGPGWMSKREWKLAKAAKRLAQRDAILGFSKRHPKAVEAHRAGKEPVAGLQRKLILNGNAHEVGEAGALVLDVGSMRMVPKWRMQRP